MPGRKLLLIHQNYPGQFRYLGPSLARMGWEVRALRQAPHKGKQPLPQELQGVALKAWQAERSTTLGAHPWGLDNESKLIRGEAAAIACEGMAKAGWHPDLIVGHPGWGELLFLRCIWPEVPQLHYLEFHYAIQGLDVGFDHEFAVSSWQEQARVQAKTAHNLANLEMMDQGISPTKFQACTYPKWAQSKITVIHDGIETNTVKPNPAIRLQLKPDGPVLSPGDPVVSFVNRNLEPYRGYHRFMRALPDIQKRCPKAITVIVGGDSVSYGSAPPDGKTWKQIYLDEVADDIDLGRVVFTGALPYTTYLALLQVSACHVYLTYPFVLGWSCLEAMAAGALVVGSATPPLQEVIEDGHNGLLVDFFDQTSLVSLVCDAIDHPDRFRNIRYNARKRIIDRYDLNSVCLPEQIKLIEKMIRAV